MQLSDAHYNDALEHYLTLQNKGDNSINVMVPLLNLYVHYGEMDKAIELLKSYVEKNPKSVEGHKRLAALYKSSQRFHHYCGELEIVQDLAPSVENLRDLADTYDFLGLYEQEMKALARLVTAKDYHPREEDYVGLASFYRVDHKSPEAVETILAVIDNKKYDVNIDTMRLAMQLLLEAGEEKKAFSIAQHYLHELGGENNAIALSALFQQQERFDSAYALLTPYLVNIDHSPDLLQQITTLQLARNKMADVYAMLLGQFAKGPLPDQLSVTLIDLALKYKDYTQAESVIRTVSLEKMSEDDLLRYADQWFELKRPNIAMYMQIKLGKEYLYQAPLLAALLDVAVHDTPETMAALLSVPSERIVTPEQKMIVASIYVQHGLTKRAFALIDGMSVSDMLDMLDAQQYAQLYLDANETGKAMQLLAAARPQLRPEMRSSADKVVMFMDIGKGRSEALQQWFKDHPDDNGSWLSDAYWLAGRYHQDTLALQLMQRLYRIEPTPQNRMELTEALLLNHRYREALGDLQSLAQHDSGARTMYLEVMADWIHRVGIHEVPEEQRKTLETSIASMLKRTDMTLAEKRNMAYLMEEAGFKDKAEELFVMLAANQPFGTQDVNELLGFWGDHLSPAAMTWLENRARSATDHEKAQWLSYLNDTGHPQTVITIVRGTGEVSPAVTIEYINALAATHNTSQLTTILTSEIDKANDPAQIKKLATIADEENLANLSTKGWRKLYTLDPGNAEAQKNLGLTAFAANHYTESGAMLEKYLQYNKGDYHVNYAYAEFLQHQGKKEQAHRYFELAQSQLSEIKQKTMENKLDEAHLLYRNNKLEDSLAHYRKLLAQYPDNKTLRADFAEVLIETEQFDEASLVLSQ